LQPPHSLNQHATKRSNNDGFSLSKKMMSPRSLHCHCLSLDSCKSHSLRCKSTKRLQPDGSSMATMSPPSPPKEPPNDYTKRSIREQQSMDYTAHLDASLNFLNRDRGSLSS
jgi:hypothetical protein